MAKLDVKTTWDGSGFEMEDVELNQVTNRDVIHQMIDAGMMPREEDLPRAADGTTTYYSIIDKAGNKVEPDVEKTLDEFGFSDGDTVRIIKKGGGAII